MTNKSMVRAGHTSKVQQLLRLHFLFKSCLFSFLLIWAFSLSKKNEKALEDDKNLDYKSSTDTILS